jgi:Secretion system C-terminal sorting domain/Right handed beta helix region
MNWKSTLSFRLLLATVFAFLMTTAALSATFYVATTGNDNNPGTLALPFATINKAAAIAKSGDVVKIKSGMYKPSTRIQPLNSGSANAPITFMAEVKDSVIIDGSLASSPTVSDRLGLFTILGTEANLQSWIVVDGLRIINSTFVGFYARYSSNITFKNCSTRNTGASGIIGANSSDILILNNNVQMACQYPSSAVGTNECITVASVNRFEIAHNVVSDRTLDLNNGGEGIDAKNESKNGSIHHNTVFNLVRLGIYVDAYQRNLSNVEVYANTVFNCRKGIVAAIEAGGTSQGIKIHDNIVYDNELAGIQIAGYLISGIMKDVFVYQNTVVRCGNRPGATYENCGIMVDADNPLNSNFVVRNNIVAECAIQMKTKTLPFLTLDNNLLFGVSVTPKPNASTADPNPLYANPGTGAILENPLFVNPTNANFRLQAGSPAIDKAKGTPLSIFDFYDVPRPSQQADLGAIEYPRVVSVGTGPSNQEPKISLYPNPSTNVITVSWNTEAGSSCLLAIADLKGQIKLSKTLKSMQTGQQNIEISTDSLASGVYFVVVRYNGGQVISKKMLVQQ